MESKPRKKHNFFTTFILVIAIAGIGTSSFLYSKYKKAQEFINNPNAQQQKEVKELVQKVSRLMLLPEDEEPTIATVSDFDKLKDQPFFENAHNGDKVLIYTKARLAILYDPKADKILGVTSVNLGEAETTTRVTLYNGTSTAGLTSTAEEQLKAKFSSLVISGKETAKNTYTKTRVVDLTGNKQNIASEIATLLGGETGSLPQGETAPSNTDILVILGK